MIDANQHGDALREAPELVATLFLQAAAAMANRNFFIQPLVSQQRDAIQRKPRDLTITVDQAKKFLIENSTNHCRSLRLQVAAPRIEQLRSPFKALFPRDVVASLCFEFDAIANFRAGVKNTPRKFISKLILEAVNQS